MEGSLHIVERYAIIVAMSCQNLKFGRDLEPRYQMIVSNRLNPENLVRISVSFASTLPFRFILVWLLCFIGTR
jgi:hypothetical protein